MIPYDVSSIFITVSRHDMYKTVLLQRFYMATYPFFFSFNVLLHRSYGSEYIFEKFFLWTEI